MKNKLIIIGLGISALMITQNTRFVHSNPQGAPAAHTGAPLATSGFENTCARSNCHGAGNLNIGPHSVSIQLEGNPDTLTAGQSYPVTVTIDDATGSFAGFQVVALDPNRASVGTFTAGTGNKVISGSGRSYVTHTIRILKTWNFTWKAPNTLPDSVRFFVAGMETVSSSNFRTYTTRKTIIKNPVTTSVASQKVAQPWLIFPNPVQEVLYLKNKSVDQLPLSLEITSLDGRSVFKTDALAAFDNQIQLPEYMKSGIYVLRSNFSKGTVSQMIIKE